MKNIVKIGLGSLIAATLLVGCGDSSPKEKLKSLTKEEQAVQVVKNQVKALNENDFKGFIEYLPEDSKKEITNGMEQRCVSLLTTYKQKVVNNIKGQLQSYGLTEEQYKNFNNESNKEIKEKLVNSCFAGVKLNMIKLNEEVSVSLKEKVSENVYKVNYKRVIPYEYKSDVPPTIKNDTRTVQWMEDKKQWIVFPR